ncbi:MAG: AAA family ATPase [Candidatus Caenarcaniphilales bacterium]|nr:AAA family ATPase [Candidatus Caenarcaniphilales bacterium]
MLIRLKIKDFLLIDRLEFDLAAGFNVFTGETGSGKSIILEAIQALFTPSPEYLRPGSEHALIEAEFSLNEEIEGWLKAQEIQIEDGSLTLFREIGLKGSRVRVNGVLLSTKLIQPLSEILIENHAQNASLKVLKPKFQLQLLDINLKPADKRSLDEYSAVYLARQELLTKRTDLAQSQQELNLKADFLKHQLAELDGLELNEPQEEEKLKAHITRLSQSEILQELVEDVRTGFHESELPVAQFLGAVSKRLNALKEDQRLKAIQERWEELESELTDLVSEISRLGNQSEDLTQLDQLNERLSQLQKFRRKYHARDLSDLIEHKAKLEQELLKLEKGECSLEELDQRIEQAESHLTKLNHGLRVARQELAEKLQSSVNSQLSGLGMPGAYFEIRFEELEDFHKNGKHHIEFLIRTNAGDTLKPLSRILSGGELSRLALLLMTSQTTDIPSHADPTLILDEIDTGTSGRVAQLIGEKLANLALHRQILCVTHQPLVAALADRHFKVSKHQTQNSTHVEVQVLRDDESKIAALIDLISGEKDKIPVKEYALQLLNQSKAKKTDEKQIMLPTI